MNTPNENILKLSIIVPVYNVERFLPACLDSMTQQNVSMDDYEIICVDDGAKDSSPVILDEYALTYQNIHVIHKPNGGVSSARNTGLSHAKGQYIWFVDADDLIAPNCLQTIFELIDLHAPELIKHTFQQIPENFEFGKNNTSDNAFRYTKIDGITSHNSVWGAIVKASIIHDNAIKFHENMKYGEDTLFMYYVFLHSAYTCWIRMENPIYYYRMNANSAMHQKDPEGMAKRTKDLIQMSFVYKTEYERGMITDQFKLTNTKARQHLAIMGALTVLPKSSLDYSKTMDQLKKENLYPFPFLWWHITDTKGWKAKIIETVKLFFKFEFIYKIYYRFLRRKTVGRI